LVKPRLVNRWLQAYSRISILADEVGESVATDQINGRGRRCGGFTGRICKSAKSHKDGSLGSLCLCITLEEGNGVTPDGFSIRSVAVHLNCHPRRKNWAQWSRTNTVDSFVSTSSNVGQFQPITAQEIEDKLFEALRRETVESIQKLDLPRRSGVVVLSVCLSENLLGRFFFILSSRARWTGLGDLFPALLAIVFSVKISNAAQRFVLRNSKKFFTQIGCDIHPFGGLFKGANQFSGGTPPSNAINENRLVRAGRICHL